MRGRLWLLGLLICAGCSRGPDLVVIHSPGQDNNTAGWCTPNGIAFTIKNNGDQPAAASTAEVKFATATVPFPTPALAPGATADLGPAPIPAGCFQPDCGFGITADAAAKVAETNENNNKAGGACIG
jgi:CARDB protein